MQDWSRYIHRNTKRRSDCQVVAATNAYTFLTGRKISAGRYERLVKLAKAEHGSAICIREVWDDLGIEPNNNREHISTDGKYSIDDLPIQASVWHDKCGFHSILIIDIAPISHALQVLNFRWETSKYGWITEERLTKFLTGDISKTSPKRESQRIWSFRLRRSRGTTKVGKRNLGQNEARRRVQ